MPQSDLEDISLLQQLFFLMYWLLLFLMFICLFVLFVMCNGGKRVSPYRD